MQLLKSLPGAFAVSMVCLTLAGCETPPEKPYTPPPTQPPREQPQETQPREQQEQTSQAAGAQAQQAPSQSQQSSASEAQPAGATPAAQPAEAATRTGAEPPPPPSSGSADVEITDIPLDEEGNPILQPAAQQTSSGQTETQAAQQSAGGGAPNPAGGREADAIGGTAGNAAPVGGDLSGPVVNVGAATAAERSAALEQNLEAKLAKFDELMRKAREEAEQDRAASGGGATAATGRGGASTGAAESGGGRRKPSERDGEGGRAASSSGLGHTPDQTGTNRPGAYRQATGPIPNDIPDARDDDIVARQLREAATRESDPVLREKLWEEYRKYKAGIGR